MEGTARAVGLWLHIKETLCWERAQSLEDWHRSVKVPRLRVVTSWIRAGRSVSVALEALLTADTFAPA